MQRRQVPQPFSAYNDSPLISFMGLNGLSLILPNAKQEIEIQKVVEASFGSIVGMLSKKYIIPVGIPEPRGYYFMNKWLEGFAYKMNPGRGMFIIVGMVSFLMAWPTANFEFRLYEIQWML